MKKGISLIVLVITIIVMIVIAGAIILSLSSSNVTGRANLATLASDRANLQASYAVALAEKTDADHPNPTVTTADIDGWDAGNDYGSWTLVNGSVKFQLIVSTAEFDAAYGEGASAQYDWIVKKLN